MDLDHPDLTAARFCLGRKAAAALHGKQQRGATRNLAATMDPSADQIAVCRTAGVAPEPPSANSRLGIALDARESRRWPLNGLRHPPERGTNGWYIWRGDALSEADDFFKPLHAVHVSDWCPEAVRFLCLPPGWRFLHTPGQEDIWYDATLLEL